MLYNVTFRLEDESTTLIPYIPYSAAADEDRETKRVCLADSIEHCLEAIGANTRDIHLYAGGLMVVRSVNETKLDMSKLVIPEELYDTKRVPDALETNEHWYLDEIEVKREIYEIVDFSSKFNIAFTCIERQDMADIIQKYNPKSPMRIYESVEEAFDRTIDEMCSEGHWGESECFEDEILELPWAKTIKITDLILKEVKEKNYAII